MPKDNNNIDIKELNIRRVGLITPLAAWRILERIDVVNSAVERVK